VYEIEAEVEAHALHLFICLFDTYPYLYITYIKYQPEIN